MAFGDILKLALPQVGGGLLAGGIAQKNPREAVLGASPIAAPTLIAKQRFDALPAQRAAEQQGQANALAKLQSALAPLTPQQGQPQGQTGLEALLAQIRGG